MSAHEETARRYLASAKVGGTGFSEPSLAEFAIAEALLAVVERLDRIAAVLERADESHVVLGGPDAPTPVWPERGERS
jgi:hypothetical protein